MRSCSWPISVVNAMLCEHALHRLVEGDAVPGFLPRPQPLVQAHALVLVFTPRNTAALSRVTNRWMSAARHQRPVEPAVAPLYRQALLLPCWVRRTSSPMSIIGIPSASSMTVNKFFTCRLRSLSTAGSSVGPSTPQFQLRLSLAPSRLSSRSPRCAYGRRKPGR